MLKEGENFNKIVQKTKKKLEAFPFTCSLNFENT